MKALLYDDNRVVDTVDCNDVERICNSCDRNSCYVEVHMRDHTTKLCDDFVFMLEEESKEPHNTVEQTTSLWERLKLCYRALTRDYYIFFACDKDAIQFDENGNYVTIGRNKTSAFTYVGAEPMMIAYGKVMPFHDFYWHIIELFAKKAQQGEV